MKNRHEEKLQIACVRWFRLSFPDHVIFHIPNGGSRGPVEGARFKAMGVLPGVPDLFICSPSADGKHHGLFIEMKHDKGRTDKQQKIVHDWLRSDGYRVEVVRSLVTFGELCEEYIGIEPRATYKPKRVG